MNHPTLDSTLLLRARQGEAAAFESLYHSHAGLIFSLFRSVTNDIAESEELTKEAFLGVFRSLSGIQTISEFSRQLCRKTLHALAHRISIANGANICGSSSRVFGSVNSDRELVRRVDTEKPARPNGEAAASPEIPMPTTMTARS
jgi:DNA-directed RNA polymerase specialized sigma24 family protein